MKKSIIGITAILVVAALAVQIIAGGAKINIKLDDGNNGIEYRCNVTDTSQNGYCEICTGCSASESFNDCNWCYDEVAPYSCGGAGIDDSGICIPA